MTISDKQLISFAMLQQLIIESSGEVFLWNMFVENIWINAVMLHVITSSDSQQINF